MLSLVLSRWWLQVNLVKFCNCAVGEYCGTGVIRITAPGC